MWWPAVEQLRRDVAYGARVAVRHRGFSAAVILTLALGIGAATVTFSVADAIVFRPLPYADADRLVKIWRSAAAEPSDNMSLADFNDLRERSHVFEQVAGDNGTGFRVEYGGSSHGANGAFVTGDGPLSLFVRSAINGSTREARRPGTRRPRARRA